MDTQGVISFARNKTIFGITFYRFRLFTEGYGLFKLHQKIDLYHLLLPQFSATLDEIGWLGKFLQRLSIAGDENSEN